jgi:hypothetical protein
VPPTVAASAMPWSQKRPPEPATRPLATALTEESVALAMRLDSLGQPAQLPVLAVAARAMPSSTSLSVHARSLT